MPHEKGRTDRPGNSRTYKPIHIRTAHPEKLSLEDGPKVVPSPEAVLRGNDVPSRTATYERKGNNRGQKKYTA